MSVLFSRACARVLSLSVPVQFARACTRSLSSLAAADVADAAGSRAAGAAVSTPGAGGVPSREAPLTFFPQMSVTLVRRVTARMPYNHFLFRVDPKYTKADIREYLTKVYGVDVARVTTSISLGAFGSCSVRGRERPC